MYGAHSKFDNGTMSTEYRRSRKGYCLASGWQYAKKCCCETWCQLECRWPTLATVPSNEFCSKSSTNREDRYITNMALRQCTTTARRLRDNLRTATGTRVSDQTIRNCLRTNNLRCRRQAVRQPLLPRHRMARRHWCMLHLQWQRVQWGQMMFTDESRFSIQFNDGRVRVGFVSTDVLGSASLTLMLDNVTGSVVAASWCGAASLSTTGPPSMWWMAI